MLSDAMRSAMLSSGTIPASLDYSALKGDIRLRYVAQIVVMHACFYASCAYRSGVDRIVASPNKACLPTFLS